MAEDLPETADTPTFEADAGFADTLDDDDPLASFADHFDVPDAYYLDGNSLGPISDRAQATLERAIEQWRRLGIRAWTEADPPWFWYGEILGDRLASMLGADPTEVVVANSTSVNIHTLIATVLDHRDSQTPLGILVNELDFPTDHYAIRAQLRMRGYDPDEHLHLVESHDDRTIRTEAIIRAMDEEDVDIVFMPSVLYRSGQLFDIERITTAAHERDILAGFDLAHSIGVIPHRLSDIGVDFAVWCSYKYLNAGPGATAGLYVNERHFDKTPALAGWWGHDKETQFEMNLQFTPAADAGAWQIGTVPVLSSAPLFGAIELVTEAGIDAVRAKSLDLTDYLIYLIDERLEAMGCAVGTPRAHSERGGHVALEHDDAEALNLALRDHGVVADFRPPNIVRLCPSPLYVGYRDVWEAVDIIHEVLATDTHLEYADQAEETEVS